MYCAICVNCACEKIFEFAYFGKYGAWGVICNNFNTLVKYENNTILR